MSYVLGIDVGTTYTGAAVVKGGRVEVVPLGNRSAVVPTMILLREDHQFLVGEAASRRALIEASRVALEFKRRMGDSTPLLLGGTPMSPQALTAEMLRWVVGHVSMLEGGPPGHVAVSHPASWGPFKLDLLDQAVRMADLDTATKVIEPVAAAAYYASHRHLDLGEIVAVYDLGGGTFDAAVVRKTVSGFELLGTPEGIEHLGGIDVDEAIYGMVTAAVEGAVAGLDPNDSAAMAAMQRLRRDCVDAKEALSADDEAVVPVVLPRTHTEVMVTRAELEQRIRPLLAGTIDALRRALRSADVEPNDLVAVLLVGGSSRMPIVAELVGQELGRPVAVDSHPKHCVALGTALVGAATQAQAAGVAAADVRLVEPSGAVEPQPAPEAPEKPEEPEEPPPPPPPPPPPVDDGAIAPARDGALAQGIDSGAAIDGSPDVETDIEPPPPALGDETEFETVPPAPVDEDGGGAGRRRLAVAGVGAVLLLVAVIAVVVTQGGGSDDDTTTTTTTSVPVRFTDMEVVGETTFPFETEVLGRQFTSIAGIALDPETGEHLALKGTARNPDNTDVSGDQLVFTIEVTSEGDVELLDVVELTAEDGQPYGRELDAEGIAVLEDGSFVVVSEGEAGTDAESFIHRHDRSGAFVGSFAIPDFYLPSDDGQRGIGSSGGFDSLTFVPGRDLLVAGVESPLVQDDNEDPLGQKVVRLLGFDPDTGEAVREWGYPLTQINENHPSPEDVSVALAALIGVDDQTVLVWERSVFRAETVETSFSLYQIELDEGVEPSDELPPVVNKRLIWSDPSGEEVVGNFDSASLGVPTSDGQTTVVFAADCRFAVCDTQILTVQLAQAP